MQPNERTCLDIFTGLGCFSIAARVNGVRTVAMCEIKSDCRNFLAANWPGVRIHDNAKTLDGTRYKGVWLVCGGPPCQPASVAGEQRGAADHRWLWPQAVRIVGECEPTWFLFENPPGIKSVGLDGVLSDLEACGYEVGTLNIPACAVNSPQRRERLWLVGHRQSGGLAADGSAPREGRHDDQPGEVGTMGDTAQQSKRVQDLQALSDARRDARRIALPAVECSVMADSLRGELAQRQGDARNVGIKQPPTPGSPGGGLWSDFIWIECGDGKRRRAKPGICGVVNGPSVGLLEALGNAIVWPIAAAVISAMIQTETL